MKKKLANICTSIFVLLVVSAFYISLKSEHIKVLEIGNQYVESFNIRMYERIGLFVFSFIFSFVFIYLLNRGIIKGLKDIFEKENKEFTKTSNKSIAIILAILNAYLIQYLFQGDILTIINLGWFGKKDQILNIDYSYFILVYPMITKLLKYLLVSTGILIIYVMLYYIITLNVKLDGINIKDLKENHVTKIMSKLFVMGFIYTIIFLIISSQDLLFGDMLKKQGKEKLYLNGAGFGDIFFKNTAFILFEIYLFVLMFKVSKTIKNGDIPKVIKQLLFIPVVIIGLYVAVFVLNLIFVKTNEFKIQKKYIEANIAATEKAYNIKIEQKNIDEAKELGIKEIKNANQVLNKIPYITSDIIEKNIKNMENIKNTKNTQNNKEPYMYNNTNIIDTESSLVYFTPREIEKNGTIAYNDKKYEYTHGNFGIVSSSNDVAENGNILNIESKYKGQELDGIKILEPRIYYGLHQNINKIVGNNEEYDFPLIGNTFEANKYEGTGGIRLNLLERLVYGISNNAINFMFNVNSSENDRYLLNTNIISRAKTIVPELTYDEKPYLLPNAEGGLTWVIDAYSISSRYPYSQKIAISGKDGGKTRINYIRNSAKVLIDAYTGKTTFYVADDEDPIIKTIQNKYKNVFKNMDEIPAKIKENLLYPKYLYDIQSEMISVYHTISAETLYREEDVWKIPSIKNTASVSTYTYLKNEGEEAKLGLLSVYAPINKQTLNGYLVGENKGGKNILTLYKFEKNENILSMDYMREIIQKDKNVKEELEILNRLGTNLISKVMLVPIDKSMLYIESIYEVNLMMKIKLL